MKRQLGRLLRPGMGVYFVVMAVFCALSFQGKITPDNVMIVVSTVIAFYFGTQQNKT